MLPKILSSHLSGILMRSNLLTERNLSVTSSHFPNNEDQLEKKTVTVAELFNASFTFWRYFVSIDGEFYFPDRSFY